MRRCYKCGCKKYDDAILCKECAYKLEQKLKEKKHEREDKEIRNEAKRTSQT